MELEVAVLERVRAYESLSRWEKFELGRDLRRLGLSYGEIMELIPVKKSTLATWCRDVRLTEEQVEAIKKRRAPDPGSRVAGLSRNTQHKRHREIESIQEQAYLEARHLVNDSSWVASQCIGLKAPRPSGDSVWPMLIRLCYECSSGGRPRTCHPITAGVRS